MEINFKRRLLLYFGLASFEIVLFFITYVILIQVDRLLMRSETTNYTPEIPNLIRLLNKGLFISLNIYWSIRVLNDKLLSKILFGLVLSIIIFNIPKAVLLWFHNQNILAIFVGLVSQILFCEILRRTNQITFSNQKKKTLNTPGQANGA